MMEKNQLNIIVKMKFGSHLYGTATENSDLDFKGVFLPSTEEVLLNRVPKSYNHTTKKGDERNTNDDVDTEIYSLHYFLKLACEGQTVALDMLHAPSQMIIEGSEIWDSIIENRQQFYTRNLQAFIGYARRQAAKYGVKGSRLSACKTILDLLLSQDKEMKLKTIWDILPTGEHLYMIEDTPQGIKQYQVCGKIFQETQAMQYITPILQRFYNEYGKRAQQAARNEGIDWKAISHAVRAAYQVRALLTEGTITFPLKEAKTLLRIKNGGMDYLSEASPLLESLMDEVEVLSEKSELPTKVNRKWWDEWLIHTLKDNLF